MALKVKSPVGTSVATFKEEHLNPMRTMHERIDLSELDHLMELVQVTMREGVQALEVGSIKLGQHGQGERIELPRWAAEVLVGLGLVTLGDENVDLEVFRALSRERIQGGEQLSSLNRELYVRARRAIRSLAGKEEGKKLASRTFDLLNIRANKLLYLSGSTFPPRELGSKISPEEEYLFQTIRLILDDWRRAVLGEGS